MQDEFEDDGRRRGGSAEDEKELSSGDRIPRKKLIAGR
jgi:hypothetical protein